MENTEIVNQEKKSFKIQVPESVMESAINTHKELKKRGASVKIDDLFMDLFASIDSDYWDQQIEKITPDDYLIELVKQNSDARASLLREAKRLMDAINKGVPIAQKKRGRKPSVQASIEEA